MYSFLSPLSLFKDETFRERGNEIAHAVREEQPKRTEQGVEKTAAGLPAVMTTI